ncbi:MAG: hypothetical protein IJF41_03870, partial [Clostridia bacterium]|nr:hypothetical protein [Clostridia bacterium]
MKFGIRTPNLKSRVKARTTGKIKRNIKRALNPLYGKAGMGIITDPKKALYNKIYENATVGINYNLKTKLGKSIDDFDSVNDFLFDIDLDTVSFDDIDRMNLEALETILSSKQNKKLNK